MSKTRRDANRYFHGPVDAGTGNTADYVVAHGQRQRQRGKRPSVSYMGIGNPDHALEQARGDIVARELWDNFSQPDIGRVAVKHYQEGTVPDTHGDWRMLCKYSSGVVGMVYTPTDEPYQFIEHRRLAPTADGTIAVTRLAAIP